MAYTRENFGQLHEELRMSLITEETEIDQNNNNEFDIFDDRDWMAVAACLLYTSCISLCLSIWGMSQCLMQT